MIPEYIVFNITMKDSSGYLLPVGQGNDPKELHERFSGENYVIKPVDDREEW
ncbi:hypothetical protein PWO95_01995 [Weissella paramesenteroides]|uniref:hypothetical protein n=1 Tax=Weissella paramesenteroides TaxID=1249 RepID=UPI0023A922CF|nr:hypothetical protein [Weissella paramesenteroides]WEA53350.1 hypothetical protein PWO95_01995 [Weissella paramesenteroides]